MALSFAWFGKRAIAGWIAAKKGMLWICDRRRKPCRMARCGLATKIKAPQAMLAGLEGGAGSGRALVQGFEADNKFRWHLAIDISRQFIRLLQRADHGLIPGMVAAGFGNGRAGNGAIGCSAHAYFGAWVAADGIGVDDIGFDARSHLGAIAGGWAATGTAACTATSAAATACVVTATASAATCTTCQSLQAREFGLAAGIAFLGVFFLGRLICSSFFGCGVCFFLVRFFFGGFVFGSLLGLYFLSLFFFRFLCFFFSVFFFLLYPV